jgi:hypothetical protein
MFLRMMILCVFFEQVEVQNSCLLKAITLTTTALIAHLTEALWLVFKGITDPDDIIFPEYSWYI